ncbi:MAG: glutaminyl-peptide cyclotransferase [Anaerolineaceae bacterium]|nr:glutaminyl-peptide cyclotransferase [Anaerolineaceae bacterium]
MIARSKIVLYTALIFLLLTFTAAAQTSTSTPIAPDSTAEATPEATPDPSQVELLTPEIISTYPHDPKAWTEGLLLQDGYLYESVGETGHSSVRKVEPTSGEVVQQFDMGADDYAEGIAIVGDRLLQMTYKQEIVYQYDWKTLKQLPGTLKYQGEGWGLTYDADEDVLWMSNGEPALFKRDPKTFDIISRIPVTLQGLPIDTVVAGGRSLGDLNELEVVGSDIYANIWLATFILRIDKETGIVTGIIDGSKLLPPDAPIQADARQYLNGIAYNAEKDTFLITGKYWPYTFEVKWKSEGILPAMK